MGFDIGRLDAAKDQRETGVELNFLDPRSGEDTGAVIIVAAYSSERVKDKARTIVKEWERKRQRNPSFMPGVDDQERLSQAMTCAAVVDWRGFIAEGKPWPCTPENIERLASDPAARKQIDAKAGDEAAFFGN
jgi:hypothetical protein